jgi:hypothetical protein
MPRFNPQFLLVEPIAKTPFPPLGLMKISSMLKKKFKYCEVFAQVGNAVPKGLIKPEEIFITSLFTWDLDGVIKTINFFRDKFPRAKIRVGGIAASLVPNYIRNTAGIEPYIGLLDEAEACPPDYSHTFGRKINASITFASRGCPRQCRFCSVKTHEPKFFPRHDWEKDICSRFNRIIFWDNNWLASPNFDTDCKKIENYGLSVDFNQGLDARCYTEEVARNLSGINMDPIRFAFDNIASEREVLRAICLAKKYSKKEIRVYVLYNFEDTPEDFYCRIDLLNREKVLSFPMEYRKPTPSKTKFPGRHWNRALSRGLKLSLLFYYRKGMITESRKSFLSIYGKTSKKFVDKLYEIYEYDKSLRRKKQRKM